ncbi:TPA: DUF3427 domain-containing protein [Vibrio parahaemolyticus]|nr:DUF3427 domain-containing protein [Vibrio parahaemolyticus]HAS6450929.1 DUF3427 domain-containing protein [Vibrio parahaemolyticus]HAS6914989.1 DUF3427 domain-containing protein [Vibrio parahaemolyticus]HAS6925463.1 DUF3427 domain-containing protein [Vibrio parahaemolyticus]
MKVELDKAGRIARLITISKPLTASHIDDAARKFDELNGQVNSYDDSTRYDLRVNDKRYPPKAIFGLALGKLLNETVLSTHFTGGLTSDCFKVLTRLGFDIVEKNQGKVTRKNETFCYSKLIIGNSYSKAEALQTARVAPPVNNKEIIGATEFKNCVVLFVTLDKSRKDKRQQYKDSFQLDGKLFQWESKKSSNLKSSQIQKVLSTGHVVPVLLFVRINEKLKGITQPFLYAGRLEWREYSGSEDSSDQPVEVMFDVVDYKKDAPEPLQTVYSWRIDGEGPIKVTSTILTKSTPPKPSKKKKQPKSSSSHKGAPPIDWAEKDEKNRSLGNAGEELVLEYEQKFLIENNLEHLVKDIDHVATHDADAGYDIKSFDLKGVEKYIEVKTTRGSKTTPFYISRNEVEKSLKLGKNYWIYRVYDLDTKTNQASFYELNGPVDQHFNLEPETYKASKK